MDRPGSPRIVLHNGNGMPPRPAATIRLDAPNGPELRPAGQRIETRPCFASSWLEDCTVAESEARIAYEVAGVTVRVSSPTDSSLGLYVVDPPEYRLNAARLRALAQTIEEVTRTMPEDLEVNTLATVRHYIKAKATDHLYVRLSALPKEERYGKDLHKEAARLAELLCKYTAGYGVLETLLEDPLVQDVYLDAPTSQTPVQVVLRSSAAPGVRQKCRTNMLVGSRDLQSFVSRVKFATGLPFSEAHPVLEADIKGLGARVTLVGPPLSDKGVSVAIRKHTSEVWTMPGLIRAGSLSPLLSSFLWACAIGRRTVLIAGSRGAGKTTLLGAMMLEFPLSQRIVLIEDTPEIPVGRLQGLGFDVQALRFSGSGQGAATSAKDALKVSLRLGESAIVIGEVRGEEAQVLYESMRAGSAGSSVIGTIHGNSAQGVLDRAVEDLGVSERAFSSTDIVVVIGLIRSPDGSRFCRKVIEVAEVRERGAGVELVSLFSTGPGASCAQPTEHFDRASKTVRGIAASLGLSPETVMDAVRTRAHADQLMAEAGAGPGPLRDEDRVASNEVLSQCLFDPDGAEHGLRRWRAWYDAAASS